MARIALVVLDTLRRDSVSPYDGAVDHTPNIQAFADDATTYTNAVAQAPWSLPSQASVLTGAYPWQHRASQRRPYLAGGHTLLQERLRDAGHRTAAFHENTWLVPATGAMRGFDTVRTPADVTRYAAPLWQAGDADALQAARKRVVLSLSDRTLASERATPTDHSHLVDATERFLRETTGDFFLFLNLTAPHYPYTPPWRYADRHGVAAASADLDSRPLEYGGPVDPAERPALERLYDAEVDYLDDVFGQVVEAFRSHGVYDDTLFVVAGDHGEHLGEDGYLGHHFSVRPELTDVPLLVRPPGGAGGECSAVTELRELHYDVLRHAGIPARDDERLFEDCAAGLYQDPVVYRDRLPADHHAVDDPQFYVVGSGGRDTTTSLDERTLAAHHDELTASLDATDPAESRPPETTATR